MRFRVARNQKPRLARLTAATNSVPAPIGGLNTRDSLAAMSPVDAIALDNFIPQQNGVISRLGYIPATATYTDTIETLASYRQGSDDFFISAAGGALFKDTGSVATSLGTGYSNARWSHVKYGANMILVNGTDAPQNFNGTVLSTPAFSGDLATYGEEKINGAHKHRNRVYLWDTRYPNVFYGGTNSISGAFTEFQLDRVSDTGGNLIEVKTISQDSGNGPDDYLAFILSTGEVLIYQGSDPSDATNFALVGKYKMPPIIAKGCATELAGDVLILTKQDIIKLSDVIKYTGETGGFNITPSKLAGAITNDYISYGSNYGWSIITYPAGGWIVINVPEVTNSQSRQYVVNVVTGGACRFTGWNGSVFGILGDDIYFGADQLYQANSGADDNGSAIEVLARQAFTNLGTGNKKKVSNARLYVASEGTLAIDLSMGFDYAFANPQGTQASATVGAEWDIADWDTAEWASTQAREINFVTGGIGVNVGLQIALDVSGQQINWYSTTYNYDLAEAY